MPVHPRGLRAIGVVAPETAGSRLGRFLVRPDADGDGAEPGSGCAGQRERIDVELDVGIHQHIDEIEGGLRLVDTEVV